MSTLNHPWRLAHSATGSANERALLRCLFVNTMRGGVVGWRDRLVTMGGVGMEEIKSSEGGKGE